MYEYDTLEGHLRYEPLFEDDLVQNVPIVDWYPQRFDTVVNNAGQVYMVTKAGRRPMHRLQHVGEDGKLEAEIQKSEELQPIIKKCDQIPTVDWHGVLAFLRPTMQISFKGKDCTTSTSCSKLI